MSCKSCGSNSYSKVPAEIAIYFPGQKGLDEPHVLVFPMSLVCLNRGQTRHTYLPYLSTNCVS